MEEIATFLNFLKYEKRYSSHTIKAYTSDIHEFWDYCKNQYGLSSLSEVRPIFLRSWLVLLLDRSLQSRSINRKLSAIKSFFKFLRKRGTLPIDPSASIEAMKIGDHLPDIIREKEVLRIFDDQYYDEGWKGLRNQVICCLLYVSGMRRSELIGLTKKRVKKDGVFVLGKGQKERWIPFPKRFLEIWGRYMATRTEQFHFEEEDLVFISPSGKELSPKAVYTIVNQTLGKITTTEKKSPHMLRHAFATHMLDQGADLNAVKALLGHSSLAATQVYTRVSAERLKNVYDRSFPKSTE